MPYKEKYFEIINKGLKDKPESGYYEHHHIIPRSICPLLKNSKQNLVYLTAKNHFLAHYYIYHWFKDELKEKKWARSMCYALIRMKRQLTKSNDIEKLSDLYKEVRIDFSEAQKGKKNHNYGKHLSEETKKSYQKHKKVIKYQKKLNKNYQTHLKEDIKQKTIRKKNGLAHKKQIIQYTLDGRFLKTWSSMTQVKRELGIAQSHISSCCKGKRKSAGNFVWKYKERKD